MVQAYIWDAYIDEYKDVDVYTCIQFNIWSYMNLTAYLGIVLNPKPVAHCSSYRIENNPSLPFAHH